MDAMAWHWRVVLVRPRNPLNIGAAARAMANFGFRELAVVAPYEPVWQETRSAVGAEDIIKSAREAGDLEEAIADRTLVVGTTSGSHRNLDRELMPLTKFPVWLRSQTQRRRAALLFGSEKTGLPNAYLSYCHALVRIPTVPRCPSMNLGQAVAVCCYELARARSVAARLPGTRIHASALANMESLEHLLKRAEQVLEQVGYLKPKSRHAQLTKLRRLILDLELTNNDVRILGAVCAQVEWKLQNP
jgi:tRNA/rRNA methyltransferase